MDCFFCSVTHEKVKIYSKNYQTMVIPKTQNSIPESGIHPVFIIRSMNQKLMFRKFYAFEKHGTFHVLSIKFRNKCFGNYSTDCFIFRNGWNSVFYV